MRAAGQTILLAVTLAMAPPVLAQPRQVPALDTGGLHAGTFDVRAFDPLGMSAGKAASLPSENGSSRQDRVAGISSAPVAATLPHAAPLQQTPTLAASGSLFSDGWSRDGFGGRRP